MTSRYCWKSDIQLKFALDQLQDYTLIESKTSINLEKVFRIKCRQLL